MPVYNLDMPIYTRAGDKGKTRTFHGEMDKSDDLAEALGAIDELNSWIGLIRQRYMIYDSGFTIPEKELKRIQTNLLIIGSGLAGSRKRLKEGETKRLERWIDKFTSEMPPLSNFICPQGELHIARAVCRRAERQTVRLMNNDLRFKNSDALKYLNRLSDVLFTLARWVNLKQGIEEEVWKD